MVEDMEAQALDVRHLVEETACNMSGQYVSPDNSARYGQFRTLVAKICQKQTCWVVLRQLLLAKRIEYIVLFEELLCDLQNLVVERKPGMLTNDAQHLRISQAAAAPAYQCRGSWRQKASALTQTCWAINARHEGTENNTSGQSCLQNPCSLDPSPVVSVKEYSCKKQHFDNVHSPGG